MKSVFCYMVLGNEYGFLRMGSAYFRRCNNYLFVVRVRVVSQIFYSRQILGRIALWAVLFSQAGILILYR